jgi:hypothetical protein
MLSLYLFKEYIFRVWRLIKLFPLCVLIEDNDLLLPTLLGRFHLLVHLEGPLVYWDVLYVFSSISIDRGGGAQSGRNVLELDAEYRVIVAVVLRH